MVLAVSRVPTWALWLLYIPGAYLTLLGLNVLGQLPFGWSDPKSFAVNILSGAATACFGVPIAFFLLQRLQADRQGRAEVKKFRRQYAESMDAIHRDLLEYAGGDANLNPMAGLAADLSYVSDGIRSNYNGQPVDPPRGAELFAERLETAVERSRAVVGNKSFTGQAQLARVSRRWAFLATELLPTSERQGTKLVSDEMVDQVDSAIASRGPFHAAEMLNLRYLDFKIDGLVRRFVSGEISLEELQPRVDELGGLARESQTEINSYLTLVGLVAKLCSEQQS